MVKLTLPIGPNINHKFISRSFVVSSKYRNWMRDTKAYLSAMRLKPIEGDCIVKIDWYRPKKQGDVDGKLKPILDAMQGSVYIDDKQVKILQIERHDTDKKNPRYEIEIKELDNVMG